MGPTSSMDLRLNCYNDVMAYIFDNERRNIKDVEVLTCYSGLSIVGRYLAFARVE